MVAVVSKQERIMPMIYIFIVVQGGRGILLWRGVDDETRKINLEEETRKQQWFPEKNLTHEQFRHI